MTKSHPIHQPQPDAPFYSVSELNLFPRLTRAIAANLYQLEPPSWNKTKRIKRWFDTSYLDMGKLPHEIVQYTYFDQSKREFAQMQMTALEASLPNLPGTKTYESYQVEPTPAMVHGPQCPAAPLNPELLSTLGEAQVLNYAIQGNGLQESDGFREGGFTIAWNGERRRNYLVQKDGNFYNVGLLLKSRNIGGVDAPGSWVLTPNAPPIWAPQTEENGDQDVRPEIPIPTRQLYDNEFLKATPFGIHVVRKDKPSELNPAVPLVAIEETLASGTLTECLKILQEVQRNTAAILSALKPTTPQDKTPKQGRR